MAGGIGIIYLTKAKMTNAASIVPLARLVAVAARLKIPSEIAIFARVTDTYTGNRNRTSRCGGIGALIVVSALIAKAWARRMARRRHCVLDATVRGMYIITLTSGMSPCVIWMTVGVTIARLAPAAKVLDTRP